MAKTPRVLKDVKVEVRQADLNPVGMFVESMLTESQFQALNGTSWILADGRSVAGSKYATVTGLTIAPDARGLVLRGKNNGRSTATGDPTERVLGSYQGDGYRAHSHPNQFGDSMLGKRIIVDGISLGTSVAVSGGPQSGQMANMGAGDVGANASETRMRNLAVNIFIKIND
jgi:hypothetical protein